MHQIVAIKIIKLGFDTKEVIARFGSDRQALMNHANLARVVDARTTELGKADRSRPPSAGASTHSATTGQSGF